MEKKLGTALVVDDDPDIRDILKEIIIEESPFWPRLADNCKKARLIAKQEDPSIIIMDYQLPDVDGLTCLDLLRDDLEKSADRRYLLISGDPPMAAYLRKDLMVMKKPFDIDDLILKIGGEIQSKKEAMYPEKKTVIRAPRQNKE